MGIRARQRVIKDHYGITQLRPPSVDTGTFTRLEESLTDVSPSPGPGEFFTVERWRAEGGCWNGTDGWTIWNNAPSAATNNRNYPSILVPPTPNLTTLATKLLARSNPSKPSVDLPAFVAELRDLPHLLKLAGDNLIKKAAALNLKYNFEIKPLVGDLKGMLDFQKEVAKRVRTLEKLSKEGKISYTQTLHQESVSDHTADPIHGQGMTQAAMLRVWGHVVWTLQGTLPQTEKEMHTMAVRAVYGLNANFATIWELVPWSWLIDWFSNVGEVLTAGRNFVPVTPSIPEIMVHWVRSASCAGRVYTGFKLDPALYISEKKTRQRVPAGLTAELPFLSNKQLSILGSIRLLSHRK